MAGKRIETEVAVTTTGTEKVEKLAKDIDKLEDTKVKVGVEADDRDVAKLLERVKQLSSQDAIVTLAIEAGQAQNELNDLLLDLREFRGTDAEAQVRIDRINETRADLDQLSDEIRRLDSESVTVDVDIKSPPGGGFDQIIDGADQAKSATANMVGNVSQDLGELGGVAGSAGVAIGQLAEYFTDSAFKAGELGQGIGAITKSFIAAAGPIAALAAGTALVTGVVQAYGDPARQAAERTKEMGEAMDETTSDTLAFVRVLRDNADALENFANPRTDGLGKFNDALTETLDFLPGVGKATIDVLEVTDRLGISMFDLAKQLAGTGLTTDQFNAKLQAGVDAGKLTADEMDHVTAAMKQYGDAGKQAAKDQDLWNVNAEEATEIAKDLAKQADPLKAFAGGFKVVMDDLRDGAINTEAAAGWINILADALGVLPSEIIAIAQAGLDDEMEATAKATEEAKEALQDWADETMEAVKHAADLEAALSELVTDEPVRRLEALTEAVEGMSDLDLAVPAINFNQLLQDEDQMKVIAEGWGETLGSEASNAAIAAMADLSGVINEQLLSAFSQSGVQGMMDSASLMRVALVEQFGPEVGQQIIESLGISDEQVVIAARVAVEKSELEETLGMLALLDQDSVATKTITLKYLAGGFEDNPQAFRDAVVGALEDEGATVPVTLKDVDTLQDELPELTAIDVPITADPKDINAAADIIADDEKWQAELGLDPEQFDDSLDAAVKSVEGSDPTAIMHLDTTKAMADARALARVLQDILRFQGQVRALPGTGGGVVVETSLPGGDVAVGLNALDGAVGPEQLLTTTTTTTSGFFDNPTAVTAGRPIVNNITNVTIPTADPSAMVRALQRWSRSNGALPISRGRG